VKKVIAVTCLLACTPTAVFAQAGSIGLFRDSHGESNHLADNSTTVGVVEFHVVHVGASAVSACAFSAPAPNCLAATYLGDTPLFAVTIGSSQSPTGVSIGYSGCLSAPVHVLSIRFFSQGLTGNCCVFPIEKIVTSGRVEVVDCSSNLHEANAIPGVVNATGNCDTGYKESTWGRVKASFGE